MKEGLATSASIRKGLETMLHPPGQTRMSEMGPSARLDVMDGLN